MSEVGFSAVQLDIVRFAAIECELQQSGERSVYWMLNAWDYALGASQHQRFPTQNDILDMGASVEPKVNKRGYRKTAIQVGRDYKPDWRLIPRQMENLCLPDTFKVLTPAEWFREFEDVHPFRDGNGRVGQIIFNWLNGTLDDPVWAPNFFKDPRRLEGAGA